MRDSIHIPELLDAPSSPCGLGQLTPGLSPISAGLIQQSPDLGIIMDQTALPLILHTPCTPQITTLANENPLKQG